MKRLLFALALAVSLAACSDSPSTPSPPLVPFFASGNGDGLANIPNRVTRVRIEATTASSCQNFIMRIAGRLIVNVIIGTCAVADSRSPFSGTYAIAGGGLAEVTGSTGVSWFITEVP